MDRGSKLHARPTPPSHGSLRNRNCHPMPHDFHDNLLLDIDKLLSLHLLKRLSSTTPVTMLIACVKKRRKPPCMRPFTLDHALSCAAHQFRRSEFLTYILETKVPGLHFNVDDEERLPKSTMSTHMLPRIVDGAREAHMIAGHLQNEEGRDSDNAAMKILEEQDSKGDPSPVSEEDLKFTGGEPGDVVSDGVSHSQCLQFLCSQGSHFLMKNLKNKETICSVLLDMAEHVKVLPPGNEPLPWDVLNMTLWKASLCELLKEMKIVEEKCSSLIGTSGVYVLTTSPYSAFLRALSAEIADAAVKIQLDN